MPKNPLGPVFLSIRCTLVLCVAATLALAAGCAKQPIASATPAGVTMSPKLGPMVYFEQGAVLFVGADSRAAQYMKDETMFPVGLGLANTGKEAINFSRESFVLEASDGQRYPLVSLEEFQRDYTRSRTDVRLADSFLEMMNQRFSGHTHLTWPLYPYAGQPRAVMSEYELGRQFWTHTYLYFPMPEGGIHKQSFSLLVTPRGSDQTFVVRFEVR
jgi:hypothetical protein